MLFAAFGTCKTKSSLIASGQDFLKRTLGLDDQHVISDQEVAQLLTLFIRPQERRVNLSHVSDKMQETPFICTENAIHLPDSALSWIGTQEQAGRPLIYGA